MNKFSYFFNKIKEKYANSETYDDFKFIANERINSLKKYTKDKISETTKNTHKITLDSVKSAYKTMGNVAIVIGKNGLSLTKLFLNHTKPGMYIKVIFYTGIAGVFTYTSGSAAYAYGTVKSDIVEIDMKFNGPSSNGEASSEYMVSAISEGSDEKKIYIVSVSYWHMMFRNIELWAKLQKGKKYKITYYGFTAPDFGIHPKIFKVEKIES